MYQVFPSTCHSQIRSPGPFGSVSTISLAGKPPTLVSVLAAAPGSTVKSNGPRIITEDCTLPSWLSTAAVKDGVCAQGNGWWFGATPLEGEVTPMRSPGCSGGGKRMAMR